MRSDELIDRARKAADIGTVAAWPDFTDARILQEATERMCSLMAEEEIRARAGYGLQFQILTASSGQRDYPVPSRAVGGAFEKLEVQLPGQTNWVALTKVEVNETEEVDLGATSTGRPTHYLVQDGFVQLYKTPDAAYALRFSFYLRPSQLVTSQSSATFVDGTASAIRGLIGAGGINTTARTVTVNVVPFDQLVSPPAAIPVGQCTIDIVRPNGTFACAMYSVPATLAGLVFTLQGTDSMARIQVGDYVRVADQTDWPMGLPVEVHRMVANRTAMEIARDMGVDEKVQMLGSVVQADLDRFRTTRSPQVKSQPRVIPLRPMFSR